MLLPIVAGGPGDQFSEDTNRPGNPLGSRMLFADGREYGLCLAGATALVAGALNQQTLNSAEFDELVTAAAAVGAKEVTITTGSVALATDQAADGYLNIEDDAGEGHLYTIKSHPAIATTTAGVLTLYEQLQVALTAASTSLVFINPWSLAIIKPASAPTAALLGVSPHALPASNFGWLQVKGPASVVTDGSVLISEHVRTSDAVAGAVEPLDRDGSNENEAAVGLVMEVAAGGEHSLIHLQLS